MTRYPTGTAAHWMPVTQTGTHCRLIGHLPKVRDLKQATVPTAGSREHSRAQNGNSPNRSSHSITAIHRASLTSRPRPWTTCALSWIRIGTSTAFRGLTDATVWALPMPNAKNYGPSFSPTLEPKTFKSQASLLMQPSRFLIPAAGPSTKGRLAPQRGSLHTLKIKGFI